VRDVDQPQIHLLGKLLHPCVRQLQHTDSFTCTDKGLERERAGSSIDTTINKGGDIGPTAIACIRNTSVSMSGASSTT
jgi:hypothetical protein